MNTQVEDIIRSLRADLPFIQCDPGAKNTVQLLLNRIDEQNAMQEQHDQIAQAVAGRTEQLVIDLLNIIETGIHDHQALAKARRIAARRGAYVQYDH
ncbi:hypothetical protein QAO71_10620 [Halopseudomonas sp. SMJS2]|uniref:hypothetical protein n=1 Tax=Halopseudomonas sp. SMJS2 TaxID=3041098 RepID=UPI00245311F5|nr:hypothetical protein [Halopseudomonas sp. SMJS2]WGK60546.1 hypothetical protein QAO71_10620 [Halopseudomonas sp. SMJS2]